MAHRSAIQQFFGLPRTSPVGTTLDEARDMPLSLRAEMPALHHVDRMCQSPHGLRLSHRLCGLPHSRMGRYAHDYALLVSHVPNCGGLATSLYQRRPLHIRTTVPGVKGKRRTPQCALQQETAAAISDDLAGRVHIYTDSSVLSDGSAAAACILPQL